MDDAGMRRVRGLALRLLDAFGVLGMPGTPRAPYGYDFTANVMHVDEDGVCPRCLSWIGPDDIVRRTAFGPAQHEVCPAVATTAVRR